MAEAKNEGVLNTGSGNIVIGNGNVIGGRSADKKPADKDPKK